MKPHHFVDILADFGRGATPYAAHPYGHALHSVAEEVLSRPETVLEIELGADDICAPCIHNINGMCDDLIDTSYRPAAPKSKREWNLIVDNRWCERLGIRQGDRMTARHLCELIRDRAGDLSGIYQEIPAEMVARRQEALAKGIARYLRK